MSSVTRLSEKPLALLIKAIRSINELTQGSLGQLFEPSVTQSTIARWENGEQMPDRVHFPKVAYYADLTLEEVELLILDPAVQPKSWDIKKKVLSPNKKHLKILKKGVTSWNRWRKKNPDIIPELCGVELNPLNLRDNLTGINLDRADLRGAKLNGLSLDRASLEYANFKESKLQRIYFDNSNLSNASFGKAILHNVFFDDANLSKSDFSEAEINRVSFRFANLAEANFSDTTIIGGEFRDAICNRASFDNSVISNTVVYGASFWASTFNNVRSEKIYISDDERNELPIKNIEFAELNFLERNNPSVFKKFLNELQLQEEAMNIASSLLDKYGSCNLSGTTAVFNNVKVDGYSSPYVNIQRLSDFCFMIIFCQNSDRSDSFEELEYRTILSKEADILKRNLDINDIKILKNTLKNAKKIQSLKAEQFMPIILKIFKLQKSSKIIYENYTLEKTDSEIVLHENTELFDIPDYEVEQLRINITEKKIKIIRANLTNKHLSDFQKLLLDMVL